MKTVLITGAGTGFEHKSMIDEAKQNTDKVWTQKIKDEFGTRHRQVQACYDMTPEQHAN